MNDIRIKQKISDQIMILKAGGALQGKARRFFNRWRPLVRNWTTFENDLLTAFPVHETWHSKLLRAANMKSSDFDSISEYGIEKVRSLYRHYSDLPWNRILSPVINGISSRAIREGIRLHHPENQKELMILLRRSETETEVYEPRTERIKSEDQSKFLRKYFTCGRNGHKKDQCRMKQSRFANTSSSSTKTSIKGDQSTSAKSTAVKCTFCHRVGHEELTCFKRNGKPEVRCMSVNRCEIMPTATISLYNGKHNFSYIVDSGADWSLIHHHIARTIKANIILMPRSLSGFGKEVQSLGYCQLYVTLQEVTLEIEFLVVPDNTIPGVDALIGGETISRPGVIVVKRNYDLDLKLDSEKITQIKRIHVSDIKTSGLDEQQKNDLQKLLNNARARTPKAVTTGKLRIQLTDDVPIAFRPRRLAIAERAQLRVIIQDLLE